MHTGCVLLRLVVASLSLDLRGNLGLRSTRSDCDLVATHRRGSRDSGGKGDGDEEENGCKLHLALDGEFGMNRDLELG